MFIYNLHVKNNRLIVIPISIVMISWAFYMTSTNQFHLFEDNWFMSVTMIFASFIAGATSEGGGAVAFPIMTLFFKIKPAIARDFSLMIQSFGMIMAGFAIYFSGIRFLKKVILISSLGGILGIFISLNFLAELLTPSYIKIFFTSLWLSFAVFILFIWLKGDYFNKEHLDKPNVMALLLYGILGGMISGLVGTGIDILIFSYLTLRHRICLKIATPTSVILMGLNSFAGFFIKERFLGGMEPVAWNYLLVAIPIVIFGAPFGAVFINERSKKFVLYFLVLSIVVQFISSLIIIPLTFVLMMFSLMTFVLGSCVFYSFYYIGKLKKI